MDILSIDIETYSSVDLKKSGAYAYSQAPDFEILLLAYAFNDEEVEILEFPTMSTMPFRLKKALTDESVIKTAYNANFERTCLARQFGVDMSAKQWECTMVHGLELGLPGSLAMIGKVFGDEQKDTNGKALISYFCKPCKPSKANDFRTRNLPEHDKEKWDAFKEYCKQDVVVERAVKKKLSRFPFDDRERYLWQLDQRINDRGVKVDNTFIKAAIYADEIHTNALIDKAKALTGLENPKSVAQLKSWIMSETGEPIDSLTKDSISELMEVGNKRVKEVLKLRTELGKTSVSKYQAMERCVCPDGRIRGLLQFYGAGRTGRWAGRLVQVQNLPQNHLSDIYTARDTVRTQDYSYLSMMYDNIPSLLSQLIRTAFIPDEGKRFIVCDFSAIEARVIAYLSGEQWRMEVFKTHGKIYEASAAQMFGVPVESIKKGDPLRQKGKVAELALGYGGSTGALISMGALKMGLDEQDLKPLVNAWRLANPAITNFWYVTERAAMNAIRDNPTKITANGISFYKEAGILFIGLPSGRRLAYVKPEIGRNDFGGKCITYKGMNQTTNKWERLTTFGGKLVENIVQAFSRDCLAVSIARLEEAGYTINFHVHDEVVIEVPYGESSVEEVSKIMCAEIPWAKGLPLKADGYECDFYMKD